MLSFFKPKPTLKDLIPNGFTDIHSHIMFGIDDGAQTREETLFLIERLKNMGITNFITTPHTFSGFWDNTSEKILAKEKEVKELFQQNNITNSFKTASEYLLDDHFVELFQNKDILTLKDNYVLVEMSYLNPPIQLYTIIFDMQVAGYKPVLAHPERYTFYHKNFDEYKKLKNQGCLFQLNLLSTVGYYGSDVQNTAFKLLKSGMIDFVGSDTHHKKHIEAFDTKIDLKDLTPLKEAFQNNSFFK